MAASTIYLIRKNRQWAKYDLIEGLTLTGAISSYSSVTGVASTDVITVAGSAIPTGTPFYFQSIAGGAGLTTSTIYWAVNSSGSTLKASLTPGGAAVDFTTDITAAVIIATADEMNVWSSEFRDTFNQTGDGWAAYGTYTEPEALTFDIKTVRTKQDFASQAGVVIVPGALSVKTQGFTSSTPRVYDSSIVVATETMSASVSDEVAHHPLRQTLLKRTHWKFDRGSSAAPRYLYATWADGDIIANNPPETST